MDKREHDNKLLQEAVDKYESYAQMKSVSDLADVKLGTSGCSLCGIYYKHTVGGSCKGCPIKEHTGVSLCERTPYGDVSEAYDSARICYSSLLAGDLMRKFRAAAKKEAEFLKGLIR